MSAFQKPSNPAVACTIKSVSERPIYYKAFEPNLTREKINVALLPTFFFTGPVACVRAGLYIQPLYNTPQL